MNDFYNLHEIEQEEIDRELDRELVKEEEKYKIEQKNKLDNINTKNINEENMNNYFLNLENIFNKKSPSTFTLFRWAKNKLFNNTEQFRTFLKETKYMENNIEEFFRYAYDFSELFEKKYEEKIETDTSDIAARLFNYYF